MKSSRILQKTGSQEKRGRPVTRAGAYDKVTAIRLSPEFRAAIDIWAARQDDHPPRSEAIRRLAQLGLDTDAAKPRRTAKGRTANDD
jgi:hypothetical protein